MPEERYRPMSKTFPQIASLLLGMGIVQLGNGLLTTIISLRMKIENFPAEIIGLVLACYFAGQMIAARTLPRIVERVGPVRTFAAAAALLAAAALSQILLVTGLVWTALRTATGYGMAGLNMVVESWLNARASNENRGQVLALYMIMVYLATGLGQFLLNLASPGGFELFALATVLITVGLIPVALTRAPAPVFGERSTLGFRALYRVSPLGVVGVLGTGLVNGAFYGLGPIFARDIGLDDMGVSSFMGVTIIAGLAMQWPVGRLSDIYDRRTVLMAVFFAVAGACILMSAALRLHPQWTLLVGALYGGLSFTTYSLSVAHACDFLTPKDLVKASGGFVFTYGIGAVIGPPIASIFMSTIGPDGLFIYSALVNLVLAGFAIYRMFQRAPMPKEQQRDYVSLPETTPVVRALDPHAVASGPVRREGHPLVAD
ncbi:MAG: MFS transporter [Alphaproteobacteria bacterium]